MIDAELDDTMADLLQVASERGDGTLLASYIHPVGPGSDPWRAPAMLRLCTQGRFEFRERPVAHYALTDAGRVAARTAA